jgi:hypothetical protein
MNMSKVTAKTFNLRQACQMLPLVQSIVTDIVELAREVAHTRQRLHELGKVRITTRDSSEIYHDEVLSIESVVKEQTDRILEYQRELVDLGLGTDRVLDGYADFPSIRLNDPIFLCWKLGEPDVRFWRRIDQPCEHRQGIDLEIIRQSGDHALI